MNNDDVITALENSLGEASNPALQVHLAGLLLDAGRSDEAFEHCLAVLREAPDDRDALALAVKVSKASGHADRGARYENMLRALDLFHKVEDSLEEEPAFDESAPKAEVVPLHIVTDDDTLLVESERPHIDLNDVAGMENVKRRLTLAFLGPLKNPELRKLYGASLKGGLLLWGPPGCGKTYFAKAIAGELGANFFNVRLDDVLDPYSGQSEANLHKIFESARKHSPCVLFFDEIDALAQKRANQRGSSGRNVVVQLLTELDGVASENEGVFVLGATNHPWDVDTAIRRPGRLDRTLLVLPPDVSAREAILRSALRDKPTGQIDYARLAKQTPRFSGADMVHLADSATELALMESVESGKVRHVEHRDLESALKEVRESTSNWLHVAQNYAEFANDNGNYDDLLEYIRMQKL